MKRLIIFIILISTMLSLNARYSPYFSFDGGYVSSFVEDENYSSFSSRLIMAPLSYRIKRLSLAIPLSFSYVTHSSENNALRIPEYYKKGIGIELTYHFQNSLSLSSSFNVGIEDYIEQKAILHYYEAIVSFDILLSPYLSLSLPFSYTYTPESRQLMLGLALKIGGEI